MEQGVQPKAEAPVDKVAPTDPVDPVDPAPPAEPDGDADHARDERVTRWVHVVLGLVIAGLGGGSVEVQLNGIARSLLGPNER